jgi:ATP-dependent DNA helicase RecG
MNSERLSRLLASRERETLEFKKAEHHIPDSLYETICAFLNHRGGDVLYQDRIEFTNPCTPHWQGRLDPQSLVPYQRNPLISKFFLQLGWVEEIGSGLFNVQRYLPYYASQGRLEVYEEDLFRVVIVLEATPQATPQAEGDRITQNLKYCVIPRSREEIQTFLGLKDREYVRKEILDPLISAGKLELTIPDKPHSPKQKYQTRGVVS